MVADVAKRASRPKKDIGCITDPFPTCDFFLLASFGDINSHAICSLDLGCGSEKAKQALEDGDVLVRVFDHEMHYEWTDYSGIPLSQFLQSVFPALFWFSARCSSIALGLTGLEDIAFGKKKSSLFMNLSNHSQ